MRSHSSPHDADGSATPRADPSASTGATNRHLSLVKPASPPNEDNVVDQAEGGVPSTAIHVDPTFAKLRDHLDVAVRLGLDPLTVTERATSLLALACSGWRRDGRCTAADNAVLAQPHPRCARAQYHHDVLLLEHGLLKTDLNP